MPTVETSKELNRKRVFRLLLEALKSKHTDSETMDGTGVIRNVVQASGIEQRIYTACIDAKGDARDQRMRHSVVYRQMAREALGHIQSSYDVTTCNVDRLADDAAAAAVRPLAFVDEDAEKQRQLQSVQQRMKTKVRCTKCSGAAVVYEKQERSSDEGATVYHQCVNPDCKFLLRIA